MLNPIRFINNQKTNGMKKFTRFGLLMALLAVSAWGFAQSTIDYETVGNSWTWTAFENGANPNTFSLVANPYITGINTSANCAKFIANADGQPWAGFECSHGDFGPFELTTSNNIVKIMVYKSVISDVGIKFVTATSWAQPELKVSNTLIDQWEELTFDFTPYIGIPGQPGPYDQIVVFPDFAARTTANTCYIDNISFNTGSITAVGEPDKSGISVYPNPVRTSLFVKGQARDAKITILDVNGKVVISNQFDSNVINTNNLAKGVYTIRIVEKSGITMKKFVKE